MIVINISLIDHICDQLIFDQHNRDQLVKINIFLINIIVVVMSMYQRNGFIDKVWMYQLLMGVPSDDSNGDDDTDNNDNDDDDDDDDNHDDDDDDNYRRSGSIDKVWMYQLLMCVPS